MSARNTDSIGSTIRKVKSDSQLSKSIGSKKHSSRNPGHGTGTYPETSGDGDQGGYPTQFPLKPPVVHYGTVDGTIPIDIDMTKFYSTGAKMIISGNVTINLLNPPAPGKSQTVTIIVKQDVVGGHSIIWGSTVIGNPQPDVLAGVETVFEISTFDQGFTFHRSGTGSGGSGLADPARQKRNIVTPVALPGLTVLDWSAGSMFSILLDKPIELSFINAPPAGDFQITIIKFIQNNIGNHTVTFPTPETLGAPEVSLDPNSITTFAIYTEDNGSSYIFSNVNTQDPKLSKLTIDTDRNWNAKRITNAADPISAQDVVTKAFVEANFLQNPMTVPLQMGNNDITQVKNIDMDNSLSKIQGLQKIEYFQSGQLVESIAGQTKHSVAAVQSHTFFANTVEIARFTEVASGIYRLDMKVHAIENSKDIRFDDSGGVTIFPGTEPAIGYDSANSRLKINYPTGASIFVTENNTIGSTQIKSDSVSANIINANDLLQMGVNITVPTVEGEFRNDGTKTTVFSGGAVRDLSEIGISGATILLDNLGPTAANASLIPDGQRTHDLGSALKNWDTMWIDQVKFDTHIGSTLSATSVSLIDSDNDNLRLNTQGTTKDIGFFIHGVKKGFANNNGLGGWSDVSTKAITLTIEVSPPAINGRVSSNGTDIRMYSGNVLRNVSKFPEINKTQTWTADQISDGLSSLGTTANPWNNIVSDNTLFCSNLKAFNTDTDINIFHDLDLQLGATIDYAGDSNSASAGTNGDVPSQVVGFIIIKVNGVNRKVPYYGS